MNTTKAREYLVVACQTSTGCELLQRLGYGAIIDAPDRGDDESTRIVADALCAALHASYPALF